MSVRFSLRFVDRSWRCLLGLAMCEESDRKSVVAIMGAIVVCALGCRQVAVILMLYLQT
jgi:hypothetical protein